MAVFREVEIEWGGETFTVIPTLALIRKIEREVSLARFQVRAADGDMSIGDLAFIAATVMRSAGADVSDDEMFAQLSHASGEEGLAFAASIMEAIAPQAPDAKKLAAPERQEKPKKKAKAD